VQEGVFCESMSRMSSTAAALAYDDAANGDGRAGASRADRRAEPWRSDTLVRVVRNDSVVHFTASSLGQARQLLDQALELLVEMDARRARRSHLHPSWR
jgi:hypothetical protein